MTSQNAMTDIGKLREAETRALTKLQAASAVFTVAVCPGVGSETALAANTDAASAGVSLRAIEFGPGSL
jgi:hypothetical protein